MKSFALDSVFSFLLKKATTCFQRSRILTINLDLIVLQSLSSLISGHTGISPSILFFSTKNLQGSPTCGKMGDDKMIRCTLVHVSIQLT